MRERPCISEGSYRGAGNPSCFWDINFCQNFYNGSAVKLRHCSQLTIFFVSYTVKLVCMEFHAQHVPTADNILDATFCKIGGSKSLDILEAYKCNYVERELRTHFNSNFCNFFSCHLAKYTTCRLPHNNSKICWKPLPFLIFDTKFSYLWNNYGKASLLIGFMTPYFYSE